MSGLALVTGASSGIGRATASLLAQRGWTVVAMARRQAALDELSKTHGESIIAMACDGGDGTAVIEFAKKVKSELGVPDLIINSAGAGQWLELEDTSPADLNTMLDAPFRSAFHVTQAFVKEMIDRGSGRILHINSPACILPWAGCTGYAATRFALRGLNEAMHADLSGTGVTTCNVIFGEVSSEYFEANPNSKHKLPTIAKLIPVMTPERCAQVILGLVNSRSREIIAPFMARGFIWLFRVMPWLVRYIVRRTQRQRIVLHN